MALRRQTDPNVNWLDLVLLAAIGFSTFSGYRNGFIRELVSIASVILASPLAGIFYDDMFPKVEPIVRNAQFAALLSFVAILAGVLWFAPSIGHHMSQTLRVIMTRLMGMIPAAIAVEMILTGLAHTFPAWVK